MIMIIVKDQLLMLSMKQMLMRLDIQPVSFDNLQAGLDYLSVSPNEIDSAIIDWKVDDALRSFIVSASKLNPYMRILVYTDYTEAFDEGFTTGSVFWKRKPYELEEIILFINDEIRRRNEKSNDVYEKTEHVQNRAGSMVPLYIRLCLCLETIAPTS